MATKSKAKADQANVRRFFEGEAPQDYTDKERNAAAKTAAAIVETRKVARDELLKANLPNVAKALFPEFG